MSNGDDIVPLGPEQAVAHITVLTTTTRFMLARHLDPPATTLSKSNFLKDYVGLSELMGFDANDAEQFKMKERTKSVLAAFGAKGSTATIGKLFEMLAQLERYDVINDEALRDKINSDIELNRKRQEELSRKDDCYATGNISSMSHSNNDAMVDEFRNITVGEVESGRPEIFDAFVSYSAKDYSFVKEMMRHLEGTHHLKLCVNARDLVIGTAYHTVTAKIIAERCKKVVIILSPNFLEERECDFQVKLAHALSPGSRDKKMVPIMFELCEVPLILRHVTIVDYNRLDVMEWFWGRLGSSLKAKSYNEPTFSLEDDQVSLNDNVYDIEQKPREIYDELTSVNRPENADSQSTHESKAQEHDETSAANSSSTIDFKLPPLPPLPCLNNSMPFPKPPKSKLKSSKVAAK